MKYLTASLLILTMFLTGCGSSNVVTALELVTAASEAAIGALEATGQIPPGTAMQIDQYLAEVSTATQFASTELTSTDTTAVKTAKIAAQFANIAAPDLGPGTAQAIVQVVAAVAKAVSSFLATIQPPPAQPLPKAVMSENDKEKLQAIRSRAAVVYSRATRPSR